MPQIGCCDILERWKSPLIKLDKLKMARDLQSLEGGKECFEVVQEFKDDPRVLTTFKHESQLLLQGHVTCSRYNTCLGLLAACLMYW